MLVIAHIFRASTRVDPSGAAFCNQNRETLAPATTDACLRGAMFIGLALKHRPTPTSEVVAYVLVVARFWLTNIVPPGRAEAVTSGGDVGSTRG